MAGNAGAENFAADLRKQSRTPPGRRGSDNDDPIPQDIDEFRYALVRRMQSFMGSWRECSLPICKRVRACRGAKLACMTNVPRVTAKQWHRGKEKMRAAVKQAIEAKEQERRAAAAAAEAASIQARASAEPVTRSRRSVRDRR